MTHAPLTLLVRAAWLVIDSAASVTVTVVERSRTADPSPASVHTPDRGPVPGVAVLAEHARRRRTRRTPAALRSAS